ncbi:MAG: hypothetical protein GF418_14150 [Chitinivibrionales bacterium]|nr:hypothetical protein [Chitinivibrionales bacterium]MBD3396761.1 hypothetical protein [Chitinivibrionales bacterium]
MDYRVIKLSSADIEDADPCDVFDAQLASALSEGAGGVALCLRPEMGACVELLDWLSTWRRTFSEQKSDLVIVADDPTQLQYLELSHPDEHLSYVASLEDLWRRFPAFRPTRVPGDRGPQPSQEPAAGRPTAQDAPVAPAAGLNTRETLKSSSRGPAPDPRPAPQGPAPPDLKMRDADTVKIAGEYACLGCGTTRMYAKGDRASNCANPECANPSSGWKLVFELF